jgi:hypothetical protein
VSRSRGLLVGAAIVGGCVIAGVVLLLGLGDEHQGQEGRASSPGVAVSGGSGQAQQVAVALAQLATDPAGLVPAGAPPGIKANATRAVPKGSSITARPESWQPDGVGGGVMTVTIRPPGQPAVSYAAVMSQENGSWKVMATLRLPSQVTSPTATAS